MDFLNKTYTQVADVFHAMTPAARVTTGLLLATVLICLCFLFRQQATTADYYLFDGEQLSQSDVAVVVGAFSKAKLKNWEVLGNRVSVPRNQKDVYVAAIVEENAFPETPSSAWQKMFTEDNPFKSKQMRELEAARAQERSLARVIMTMPAIEVATVQIDVIDTGEFPRRKEKRASVSIKAKGNDSLDLKRIEGIRTMVAYGGGMESHNVNVIDLNTGQPYMGREKDGPLVDNVYAERQRETEDFYKAKIADLLSAYQGLKVAVHAELDEKVVNHTYQHQYDPKSTPVEQVDYNKETTTTLPADGGRPGAAANGVVGNTAQEVNSIAASENSTTERREEQKAVTGETVSLIHHVPFVPKWMSVSVLIPRSHFERVWRRRNPAVPGEDPQEPPAMELKTIEKEIVTEIESAVNTILPQVAQGENPFPRVAVVPYTETPLPIPAGPSVADTALQWLSTNWQTIGLFVLAIAGILVLRGMIRSAHTAPLAAEENTPVANLATFTAEESDEEEEDDFTNSLKARFQTSGRSLRDELTELVREDPDAAASVLQNWIGDAA